MKMTSAKRCRYTLKEIAGFSETIKYYLLGQLCGNKGFRQYKSLSIAIERDLDVMTFVDAPKPEYGIYATRKILKALGYDHRLFNIFWLD